MIRASICNGEQVTGFRDIKTCRFEEILHIRKPSDLETFKAEYGIEGEIRKEYMLSSDCPYAASSSIGNARIASFDFIAYEQSSCVNVPEIYYSVY